MSDENNLKEPDKEEKQEKPFQKGWKSFVDGIKGGFENFQQSLEEQSKKNKDFWEENKEKANKFFKDTKKDWDNKLKKLNTEMEKGRLETKEQWDVHTKKVKQEINNWQEKTRQDWNDGFKIIRRGFFKAYFWALLLILPIVIIILIIAALVNWVLP